MSKVIAKFLGEELIMMKNYGMVTILRTGSLVTTERTTLERNPADIFPASKVNYT
jgi:hypothetical protein